MGTTSVGGHCKRERDWASLHIQQVKVGIYSQGMEGKEWGYWVENYGQETSGMQGVLTKWMEQDFCLCVKSDQILGRFWLT